MLSSDIGSLLRIAIDLFIAIVILMSFPTCILIIFSLFIALFVVVPFYMY